MRHPRSRRWRTGGTVALVILTTLLAVHGPASAAASAVAPFQTIAPTVILMDATSGAVLFEKNADELIAPASTAKIMTAELVFRQLADGRQIGRAHV